MFKRQVQRGSRRPDMTNHVSERVSDKCLLGSRDSGDLTGKSSKKEEILRRIALGALCASLSCAQQGKASKGW